MDEVLKPDDIARMIGAHGNTIRNWIKQGYLPALRTPTGYYFVYRRDFEEFLKRNYNPFSQDEEHE
jgi:excisionase family DNA binding protein